MAVHSRRISAICCEGLLIRSVASAFAHLCCPQRVDTGRGFLFPEFRTPSEANTRLPAGRLVRFRTQLYGLTRQG